MARRKNSKQEEDKNLLARSTGDVSKEITSAIWDAAGKFNEAGEAPMVDLKDPQAWDEQQVLTFAQFVTSPDHMNFPPLSPRQLMVSEYMFGERPSELFSNNRNTAVLVWGKGSGKDTIAALMILYIVYVVMCLKNPQRVLQLPDNDNIDLLNVAATKEQAETVFFDKFKNLVLNWKWLKDRYDIQVSGRYFSQASRDLDMAQNRVTITNDAIIFPKRVRAFSGSSESESLEGNNLLMFVLDEADAFKVNSANRSAKKIYRILRTSASSRFKRNYKSFIISYPRANDGFIMKMYEESKAFLNIYADKAMTWEVKPRFLFSKETFEFDGVQVPMDFFDEFRQDPMGSRRAFMCDAPTAEAAYFDDPDKVDSAAKDFSRPQLFEFRDEIKDGFVRKFITKPPYLPDRSTRHVLVVDLGLKKDPTAMALMHRDQDKLIVDFVTTWKPIPNKDPNKAVIVDLLNVEQMIIDICGHVTVEGVYGDHWQSSLLMQKLRSRSIPSEVMKVDFDDYEVFKRLLYAGNILLPKHHGLIQEIKSLQLFSGRKVDHPEGGHNDMAISVVMGTKVLTKLSKVAQMSSNMAAEGEYVGENMHEAVDIGDETIGGMDSGIVIDGIPLR